MMIVSSAYWTTRKSEELLRGIGKFKKPMSLALLRIDCKRSAARTKRRGERGPLV
jgi:hypothetical protein